MVQPILGILSKNKDIEIMRDEVIQMVKDMAQTAQTYVKRYNKYQHLWTINRDIHLEQFLKYGRGLTADELEQMAESEEFKVKENKPTLDMFRSQVY